MPSVNPSPFTPCPQFVNTAGQPAVGDKLFFYAAGTTTKQNTYTNSTGSVANANPIILDALGQPSTEIWFENGLAYKIVWAPSTDTDPPTNPIRTFDNLTGINDVQSLFAQSEWIVSGLTPVYVNATQFQVSGNQTSILSVGRRIRTTNTSGFVYSTITSSVFSAVTTITVVNDSLSLDSGLNAISYGILAPANSSAPNSQSVRNSLGIGSAPDIASAAALPLSTCLGNLIRVTGTTTTTSLVMSNGQQVTCVAVGAWPIVISGLLSYTCIPGDTIRFMQDNNGTQTAVVTSRPSPTHGCCRLTAQSSANLILLPYNGNTLTINGKIATIPSAGVTLSSAGSGSTLYYIYAYLNSGVLTLERSTTGHSTDSSTGVEIKTGDPTRTLVGMAQSGSDNWISNTDTRYVLSYFNRKELVCSRPFTANRSTTLGGYTIVNIEITCFWLTWSDEPVKLSITGAVSNSGAFTTNTTIGIDNTTAQDTYSGNFGSNLLPISNYYSGSFSEGAHNSTLFGAVSGGTGTWVGGGSIGARTVHQAIVMG